MASSELAHWRMNRSLSCVCAFICIFFVFGFQKQWPVQTGPVQTGIRMNRSLSLGHWHDTDTAAVSSVTLTLQLRYGKTDPGHCLDHLRVWSTQNCAWAHSTLDIKSRMQIADDGGLPPSDHLLSSKPHQCTALGWPDQTAQAGTLLLRVFSVY